MSRAVVNRLKNTIVRRRQVGPHKFIRAWLRNPRSVGSIAPASRFLSRAMAAPLRPANPGWVVELGAGTGTVTRGILEAGVKPERLLAVERDRKLCKHLKKHFPHIRVAGADAQTLKELLKEENIHRVSDVVCCLPLLTLPVPVVGVILEQVFDILPPDGVMVQYTYGPRSPVTRRQQKRLGLKAKRVKRVLLNVPPATVWTYQKG